MSEWKAKSKPATSSIDKALEAPASPMPKIAGDVGQSVDRRRQAIVHVLQELVETTERQVTSLQNSLDDGRDPVKAVVAVTNPLAESMARVNDMFVPMMDQIPAGVDSLMQRLDVAIGRLYRTGRRHQIPMRESHLEQVFDQEDQLMQTTIEKRADRADSYYDTLTKPVTHADAAAPSADALTKELLGGEDHETHSVNRDQTIAEIGAFANHLSRALDDAQATASTIIKEPNAPKRPELLEVLAETAVDVLMTQAGSAFATMIGAGFKHVDELLKLEKHLGHGITESLLEGFKDTGKDLPKKLGAVVNAATGRDEKKAEGNEVATKLSPKSIYLNAARKKTSIAMSKTSGTFELYTSTLKRVPVATLSAILQGFNQSVLDGVTRTFTDQLVAEWVNFGKQAMEQGEEVRDVDMIPKHVSKLDQALSPYGVLHIVLTRDNAGNAHFSRAELPGVGDAVLAHIRGQSGNLANLAIYRRIEVIQGGAFNVDPSGRLDVDVHSLTTDSQMFFANIARHKQGESFDSSVLSGMQAVLTQLADVAPRTIEDRE